ncbi:AGAP012566-PA [Anopheles gambiae str. PEST]|uniref:AGAP012566-PA n=1 Tax=Anopheles gambiae TaxID=7165 RepID=A0NB42_ANOGA|nr:AGAP012566-PA [Anopheles gambiae str. PEST]
MKQVICLVILGLFCSNAVSANGNEKATAEAAVLVNGDNVTKAEAAAQSGRIFNGVAVDIARYRFAIILRLDGQIRCSAVVISLSHALTGADAVYPYRNNIQRLTLYGGSTSPTSGGFSFQLTRIAVHPNFNPNSGVSDFNIAVLTVPTNSFGGKRNIAPISLASAGVAIGTKCSVFGWGKTSVNLSGPANTLRSADMIITSEATCARLWAQFGVKITSNMVCAKGDRGADLCTGDYGNALVCSGRLTGVAILSNTCGNGRDTAYTKITASSVRSFIRSQTGV